MTVGSLLLHYFPRFFSIPIPSSGISLLSSSSQQCEFQKSTSRTFASNFFLMEYYSISCIPGSYLLILFYFRLLSVVCARTTCLSVPDHEFYVNVKKNDLGSLLTLSLSKTLALRNLKGSVPSSTKPTQGMFSLST